MAVSVRSFQDLRIWQQAMDLVPRAYRLVGGLPVEKRYALADQIRRAAVSVPANIAEGHAQQHTKQFIRHLSIARGSLAELQTLLKLSERLGYSSHEEVASLEEAITDLAMPLSGLIARLRTKIS
jgi:four helix bundle protein